MKLTILFSSTVFTSKSSILVPPRWIEEPTDKAFAQSSDARVECKADGFPKPQVTWKRAEGTIIYFFKTLSEDVNILLLIYFRRHTWRL